MFMIIIIIIITYLLTYLITSLLIYLLQLSCHSMAVVLTLVQTEQIRISIHKGNNTKNTVNTSTHVTKTPTHTHNHTLPNKFKQPQ